jgi:hypothetical protein
MLIKPTLVPLSPNAFVVCVMYTAMSACGTLILVHYQTTKWRCTTVAIDKCESVLESEFEHSNPYICHFMGPCFKIFWYRQCCSGGVER